MVDNGQVPENLLPKPVPLAIPEHISERALKEGFSGKELLAQYETLRIKSVAKELYEADTLNEQIDWESLVLTRNELRDLPEVDPLIEGILDKESLAILAGRDSTYKSFVAIDWALCIATGTDWQGRAVCQGKVLYVLGEGRNDFNRRVEAWETANKQTVNGSFMTLNRPPNLFTGVGFQGFLKMIQEGEFDFVVLDTLRRVSGGANENSSDMGTVTDRINEIKNALNGGTVLTVSHTNKSNTDTRGHSSIEDDSDIVWTTKANEAGTEIKLLNTKQKYRAPSSGFKLTPVDSASSLVLDYGTGQTTERVIERNEKLLQMCETVSRFMEQPQHKDGDAIRTGFAKSYIEQSVTGSAASIRAAIEWLSDRKFLVNVSGSSSAYKTRYYSAKPFTVEELDPDDPLIGSL